ncbi:MAG: molybdenum ABC transporter ATP-binding protein [Proteobacteria bacterium]|nr:molybdenum ABC transporter ATP-binding protein [Pseudomonadota bacterium]
MSIKLKYKIKRPDFSLDIDITIPSQGITGIFGHSGCGKTTLLRAIAGLEAEKTGTIKIADMLWQDDNFFLEPHKRPIGYVFQEPSLFAHLNIQKNIEYGLKRISTDETKISLDEAIELLGIQHLLKRQPHQLSGGEQQRVAIARALASSPKLLLMDEPLSALDIKRKQEIMPYLESLHDELKIPIIYVSHSPGEIARLADHLLIMEEGKITAAGNVTDLFSRLDLPIAHSDKASAIIEAIVTEHDLEFNLTYLDFPGGRFTVSHKALEINHSVRLRVIARDVSITLEHQTHTSILNIFPAIIEEIIPENESQFMIRLSLSGTPLLCRLTKKSASLLQLSVGKAVFAQVKSVALLS